MFCHLRPFHHEMGRPQVADEEERRPYMGGDREYIETAVSDSRQWVVLQLGGFGLGAKNSSQ